MFSVDKPLGSYKQTSCFDLKAGNKQHLTCEYKISKCEQIINQHLEKPYTRLMNKILFTNAKF